MSTTVGAVAGTAADRQAWGMLLLLAVAQTLAMGLWFTTSALAPTLREVWSLSPSQAGALTTAVQLGFVAGTAVGAILNLADVIPARRYFAISALLAAVSHALLVLAPGFGAAVALRFLAGAFLAGVYPPAMKMVATWFRKERGLAIGILVGALTVGKAVPYLAGGFQTLDWRAVVLGGAAAAAVAAALVGSAYRDGPYAFARPRFSWGLVGTVVRHRETRLAIGGYLGHMWELYAGWALVTLFFYDFYLVQGLPAGAAAARAGVFGFSVIAIGGLGSVLAGTWADRLGRERVAIGAMAVSGACSLLLGWLAPAPEWIVLSIAVLWGFTIVADSAQFSALVTEVAPPHAVGTALTVQTSLGFLLTAASIWLAVHLSSGVGWGPAFSILAVGPALGIAAMSRLETVRFNSAKIPAPGTGAEAN